MKSMRLTMPVLAWSIATAGSLLGALAANAAIITWSGTHRKTITDPRYGMTAYSVPVPNGWKFGGVITNPPNQCHAMDGEPKFTMLSPDGITAILMMPGVRWSWSSSNLQNPRCRGIDIDTAAQFLTEIVVPHLAPGARIESVLPLRAAGRAGIARQQQLMRQHEVEISARYGIPTPRITLDGARVQVEYWRDRHLVQEMMSTVISCTETLHPAMFGVPPVRRRDCTAPNIEIVRAPKGHLSALLAEPQLFGLFQARVNPQWQRRMIRDEKAGFRAWQQGNSRHFRSIQQHYADVNRAMIQRGKVFRRNLEAQTARSMQAASATQGAIDKSAQRQEMISLDQQQYTDPSTGRTIKLSDQYDHTWISSDGQTTIQNNGTFNPNGVVDPVRSSWQEIYPKQ